MNAQPLGSARRVWIAWPVAVICGMQAGLCVAAPAMKDAVTHEQLATQLRKTQQEDPMKHLPATQGGDPSINAPKDLLSQSDILCFGGLATLVPKRAVLRIPPTMANRTQLAAGVTLMGWAEFFAQNRGWITTVEVTRGQAEGILPLAEDVTKRLVDCPTVVVATYQGGPISVLPPKTAPPAATSPGTSPAAPPAQTENNKP